MLMKRFPALLLFTASLFLTASHATAAGLEFATRHVAAAGRTLWGIAAGNGHIVAVGEGGTILTSTNGSVWQKIQTPTTEWLVGVSFGAGQFIAVGENGRILASPDGQLWTPALDSGTNQRLNNVTYGGGLFLAVGENGTIVTSPDGKVWTRQNSGVTGWLRGVAYQPDFDDRVSGGNLDLPPYVVCGQTGVMLSSFDGKTWTQLTVGWGETGSDLEGVVAYSDGLLAIGANGKFVNSQLRHTVSRIHLLWSVGSTEWNVRLRGLVLTPGATGWIAFGENGAIHWPNLALWNGSQTPTSANLYAGIVVGNSVYAVGENETILESVAPFDSRLVNISSRAIAGSGAATLISGFVINGEKPKQVLIRAVGPGLSSTFKIAGAAKRSQLTINDSKGQAFDWNDDWSTATNASAIADTAARVGAFPLRAEDRDSALLLTLAPGLYTTHISPISADHGICLIEVYDGDQIVGNGSRTINLSTRAEVGRGDNILIGGFVIAGESSRTVLIRAAGPALNSRFGISGVLAQPRLSLHTGSLRVRTAFAWSAETNMNEIRQAANRAGAFPFDDNSKDSAILTTLSPGSWTVQVQGADDGTGVALLEVYDIP